MEPWIKEVTNKLDRKRAAILFSEHAAKDKNLNQEDIDKAVKAVQIGKVDKKSSDQEKQRVCFKNYFKEKEQTYFIITEYYPDFIKIITIIKKKGKY